MSPGLGGIVQRVRLNVRFANDGDVHARRRCQAHNGAGVANVVIAQTRLREQLQQRAHIDTLEPVARDRERLVVLSSLLIKLRVGASRLPEQR